MTQIWWSDQLLYASSWTFMFSKASHTYCFMKLSQLEQPPNAFCMHPSVRTHALSSIVKTEHIMNSLCIINYKVWMGIAGKLKDTRILIWVSWDWCNIACSVKFTIKKSPECPCSSFHLGAKETDAILFNVSATEHVLLTSLPGSSLG